MSENTKSTTIKTSFRLDRDTQTINELWDSIAKLTAGRVIDNHRSDEYPLMVRELQVNSLKSLVRAIEETHKKMRKIK